MKSVMIEINDKKHGPLEVDEDNTVYFLGLGLKIDELKEMGAKITQVREPLEWEGELVAANEKCSVYQDGQLAYREEFVFRPFCFSHSPFETSGKRFKAKLVEIVE